MRAFNSRKIIQTLNFFAVKEGGEINKMKAMKLIWLADRSHLRNFGRTIIKDDYYAIKKGPIQSEVKDIICDSEHLKNKHDANTTTYKNCYLKITGKYTFKSLKPVDDDFFSETDLSVLNKVYSIYGKDNEFTLSEFSHKFPEWLKYKKKLDETPSSRHRIDTLDFFKNAEDFIPEIFNQNTELLNITKDIYKDIQC